MRYCDGRPPDVLKLGTAWQDGNFELIDKTTEIAPGITLIALVSETSTAVATSFLQLGFPDRRFD